MKLGWIGIGLIVMGGKTAWALATYAQLSPTEKAAIQKGETLTTTQKLDGSVWPKVYSYKRLEATPEEAMAVFFDYASYASYLDELRSSKILETLSPSHHQVEYLARLPWPMSDERTVIDTRLTRHHDGFQIEWKSIEAKRFDLMIGKIRVERLGGGAFVAYENFMITQGAFAWTIKDLSIQTVISQIDKYYRQVQRLKSENSPLLVEQLMRLQKALP